MKNEIIMLEIDKLVPHPVNPRKDVGDITELSQSIKASGIMQNLTVVPYEGKYRVIIGHRRLAASIKAGLKQVPCVVADMDYKTQIATMLSENMQRVDLKITEQVFGVQQLLDLGENIDYISEKTGLSKASVKKRCKLSALLPADMLKKAEMRGGTLDEYIKCCEITDESSRREVLESIGTKNFKWVYEKVIEEQKEKINLPKVKERLEKLGVVEIAPNERWEDKYLQCQSFNLSRYSEDMELISLYKKTKKYFWCLVNSWVFIYEENKARKKTNKKTPKEIEADRRRKKLEELYARAYKLRKDFILNFKEHDKFKKIIEEYLLIFSAKQLTTGYCVSNREALKEAINWKGKGYAVEKEAIVGFEKKPFAPLILAYCFTGDGTHLKCNDIYGYGETFPEYKENKQLLEIYDFLTALGYEMSTEEMSFLYGSHELFSEEEGGVDYEA